MEKGQLTHADILAGLPNRNVNSHKGDFGKLLLICGSIGYTGAAALAAMGALRTGAGLVYLGVPNSIYTIEATKLNEPIVFPLSDEDGMLSIAATAEIRQKLFDKDAVLIGPGLGQCEGTERAILTVLEEFEGPVILDADGINLARKHMDIVRGRTGPTIFTPHEGEFSRLIGRHIWDRESDAIAFAKEYQVILLLKGHNTIVTDGERCYINPTGNPGMAVGGCGDVLAGMITALAGFGIDPLEAAAFGAWLHGAAGDMCAASLGQYGMLPSDMLEVLPRLLK